MNPQIHTPPNFMWDTGISYQISPWKLGGHWDTKVVRGCAAQTLQFSRITSCPWPHRSNHTNAHLGSTSEIDVSCSIWSINTQHSNIEYYALCKSSTRPDTAENQRMYAAHRKDESPYKVHLMLSTKLCSQLLSYQHSSGLGGRGVHERLGHFSLSQKWSIGEAAGRSLSTFLCCKDSKSLHAEKV